MKYFVFDTETTGIDKYRSDILSLGGHLFEIDEEHNHPFNYKPVLMYFKTDDEVPSEASKVNGLTRHKLDTLSNGMYFEDYAADLKEFFEPDIIPVAYNREYDLTIVRSNCERRNVEKPRWTDSIELMDKIKPYINTGASGRVKLMNAFYQVFIKTGVYTEEAVEEHYKRICGDLIAESRFHDALYDSFISMLLFFYCLREENAYGTLNI